MAIYASSSFLLLFWIFGCLPFTFPATDKPGLDFLQGILSSNAGNGKISSWTGDDPCGLPWEGVKCKGSSITELQFRNFGLVGILPSSLNTLTGLTAIALQGNSFSGPLPSLNGLSTLETAYFNGNKFNTIPDDFFSGLTALTLISLEDNQLNSSTGGWILSDSLASSSFLETLILTNCSLSGVIPPFLGTMPGLRTLKMAYNNLTGGIPPTFSGSKLDYLVLNNQGLTGPIDAIATMASLSTLWLHVNSISATIPENFPLQAIALRDCRLNDNKLYGEIPPAFTNATSLTYFSVVGNSLIGKIPAIPSITDLINNYTFSENHFCADKPGEDCSPQVTALLSFLRGVSFPLILSNSWFGNNPCSPLWFGISCNSLGEVISISLPNLGLNGTISPDLANLPSLARLILANNNLTGTIPPSLTNLVSLQTLDVSNNNLYSPVPDFRSGVLNTSGNPNLDKVYVPPSSSPLTPNGSPPKAGDGTPSNSGGSFSSSPSLGTIIGAVLGAILLIVIVSLAIFLMWKKKRKGFLRVQSPNSITTTIGSDRKTTTSMTTTTTTADAVLNIEGGGSSSSSLVISIDILRSVTGGFSDENVLGRGGFGVVYKGELEDGTKIAVKRMESAIVGNKGLKEFQSEIDVLTKVRHRHLVSLLGYCIEGNERILVYEYMPLGTLSQHLFDWSETGVPPLSWNRRLVIALDVARGIEYLHSLALKSFIHRDLKPSNILLGDNYRAKVSDFGLVKLAPEGKFSVETKLAGTFGYLAPEYAATGRITTKVDVYSFGVILMELMTGRRTLDENQPEERMHLVTWFRRLLGNAGGEGVLMGAFDPSILAESSSCATDEVRQSMAKMAELAGHCTAREPHNRPDMGHVVGVLSSLLGVWKPIDANGEDDDGIDLNLTLPQALMRWQAIGDNSATMAYSVMENTQSSLPNHPEAFTKSFKSSDGR